MDKKLEEKKKAQLAKLVAGILKEHVGRGNAISNFQIRKILADENRVLLSGGNLRQIVHYIRANKILPNVLASSRGYYVAESDFEKKVYLKRLKDRINSIQEVYYALL